MKNKVNSQLLFSILNRICTIILKFLFRLRPEILPDIVACSFLLALLLR